MKIDTYGSTINYASTCLNGFSLSFKLTWDVSFLDFAKTFLFNINGEC